jgi:hypothetical protein
MDKYCVRDSVGFYMQYEKLQTRVCGNGTENLIKRFK